jgi:hypothetical protein
MGKKLTYEYIKEYIESFDYKLNDTYTNSKIKLNMICNEGHNIKIRWNDFHQGHRCSECKKLKRYNILEIKEYISSFNYTCVSDVYINCMEKLIIKCPNDHIVNMRYNDFQQGKRCRRCYFNSKIGIGNHNYNKDRTRKIRSKYLSFDLYHINILNDDPNYNEYLSNKKNYAIDHIRPRIAFVENNLDQMYDPSVVKKICNLRENIRIIPKKENGSKGGKYNQDEFINWFNDKLISNQVNVLEQVC